MTRRTPTRGRRLATALALALPLALPLAPGPARAQEPAPAPGGEEEKGRPFEGYFITGLLVGLTLFIVGKSARR
jgi:hypothetical protein